VLECVLVAIGIDTGEDEPVVVLGQFLHLRILGGQQLVDDVSGRGWSNPLPGMDSTLNEDGLVTGTAAQLDALDGIALSAGAHVQYGHALRILLGHFIQPLVDGLQVEEVLPVKLRGINALRLNLAQITVDLLLEIVGLKGGFLV